MPNLQIQDRDEVLLENKFINFLLHLDEQAEELIDKLDKGWYVGYENKCKPRLYNTNNTKTANSYFTLFLKEKKDELAYEGFIL